SQPTAYGFYSSWGSASLRNGGVITVTNQGTGAAYGVTMNVGSPTGGFPLAGNLVNTGTILVTAPSGAGVKLGPLGFYGGGQAALDNSNAITAHGGAYGGPGGGPRSARRGSRST